MSAHIFELKRNAFVLWRPRNTQVAPLLIIGQFHPGNPPDEELANRQEFRLARVP